MGQWVKTGLPIIEVLENQGRIKFGDLFLILTKKDHVRFTEPKDLEYALKHLIACLKQEGDEVVYDKKAMSYTTISNDFERSINIVLHGALKKEMQKYELYPLLTRHNSEKCYIGVPWTEIPENQGSSMYSDDTCDFRNTGEDNCDGRCGVDRRLIR